MDRETVNITDPPDVTVPLIVPEPAMASHAGVSDIEIVPENTSPVCVVMSSSPGHEPAGIPPRLIECVTEYRPTTFAEGVPVGPPSPPPPPHASETPAAQANTVAIAAFVRI